MYVEWEAPETVTRPYPIVLMHGGGFQGTEWFDTPDGRPDWAQRFVETGYAILVIDRRGHGCSPYHVQTLGNMRPPFSDEGGGHIYFPGIDARHTQWPFAPDDAEAMDEFIAGYGPLPANLALSQTLDAHRTAALLDRIGPAVCRHSEHRIHVLGTGRSAAAVRTAAASAEHVRNASCCSFPRTASLAKVTKHCSCALYSGGIKADFFAGAKRNGERPNFRCKSAVSFERIKMPHTVVARCVAHILHPCCRTC